MPYELRLPLLILIVIAVPCLWFVADLLHWRAWLRRTLGVLSILLTFGVAFIGGSLQIFRANLYYGSASKDLIKQTVDELQRGNTNLVIQVLSELDAEFQPTYENRANYSTLVEQSIAKLKNKNP